LNLSEVSKIIVLKIPISRSVVCYATIAKKY
jgi:hypothetical protein